MGRDGGRWGRGGAIALKVLKTLEYVQGGRVMGYFVHLYILPLLKFNIIGKTGWQQCHLILKKKLIQGVIVYPLYFTATSLLFSIGKTKKLNFPSSSSAHSHCMATYIIFLNITR